jgi:hypothetical protein
MCIQKFDTVRSALRRPHRMPLCSSARRAVARTASSSSTTRIEPARAWVPLEASRVPSTTTCVPGNRTQNVVPRPGELCLLSARLRKRRPGRAPAIDCTALPFAKLDQPQS